MNAQKFQHFVGALLHYGRTGVEILVDPVSEAHQAKRIVLVLGARDEFRDAVHSSDLV